MLWHMLSRKLFGFVPSLAYFGSLFLTHSPSLAIIRQHVPSLTLHLFPPTLNISMFATILYTIIFRLDLFLPHGFRLMMCQQIFLRNFFLLLFFLIIVMFLVYQLLYHNFLLSLFFFFSLLFRSILMGVCWP